MAVNQLLQINTSAPAAYTEYTLAVPPGAMEVTLQLRPSANPTNLFWYMAASGSASPGSAGNLPATYATIPPGASRNPPTPGRAAPPGREPHHCREAWRPDDLFPGRPIKSSARI